MRSSRRLGLALFLAIALVAGACGGSDDGGDGGGEGAATADCPVDALESVDGPVEISVWHSLTALPKRTLEGLAEEYNQSQSKVVVRVENQGTTPTELHRKIDQAIPDRSLPALVMPDDTKTRFVADSGLFLAASDCFDADPEAADTLDDLLPIAKASYTLDGKLWPASFLTYTALVFFNRAHVEAAGLDPDDPPTTITEMIDMARTIKAKVPETARPLVIKAQSFIFEWWLSGARQALVNSDNGRGDELPTEAEFDNPTTRAILEQLKAAKDEGILDVVPGTEGQVDHLLAMATQQSSITVESSAATSTVAGVIEGTIRAEDLKEELGVDLPEGLQLQLDIGVGPYPGVEEAGRGQVGGNVLYMTNTVPEEQQAAAWDFMKFINSKSSQIRWGTEGSVSPVLRSIESDPAMQEAWSSSLAGRWGKVAYDVLANIPTDFPGPVIGPYDEVRRAIERCLDRVLLDGAPIDDAVKEADATITEALRSYNADVGG